MYVYNLINEFSQVSQGAGTIDLCLHNEQYIFHFKQNFLKQTTKKLMNSSFTIPNSILSEVCFIWKNGHLL